MRNVTFGDHQILLMVIWLVLTRVEIEEIGYERLGSCFSWAGFNGQTARVMPAGPCLTNGKCQSQL